MKFSKRSVILVAALVFCSLLISAFFAARMPEKSSRAIAFMSVGMNESTLADEVSPYEILRANEHFADIILGWAKEPAFMREYEQLSGGYSFTGRQQEKQNLIFEVPGAVDAVPAQILTDLLESRLQSYNAATNANYLMAFTQYSLVQDSLHRERIIFGAVFLTLVFSLFINKLWVYATRH